MYLIERSYIGGTHGLVVLSVFLYFIGPSIVRAQSKNHNHKKYESVVDVGEAKLVGLCIMRATSSEAENIKLTSE